MWCNYTLLYTFFVSESPLYRHALTFYSLVCTTLTFCYVIDVTELHWVTLELHLLPRDWWLFIVKGSCPDTSRGTLPLSLDPTLILGQQIPSWFRGFYLHSITICATVFLLITVSVRLETEPKTKGAKQSSITQVPKIRNVIPMRVLNFLRVEDHSPNSSLGSCPSRFGLERFSSFDLLSPLRPVCRQQLLRLNSPQTPPSEADR